MSKVKRYVQVGVGSRARFFYQSIARDYKDTAVLTAFCDTNKLRMEYANKILTENFGYPVLAHYTADEFEKMIVEQKPDVVIVTSIDRTHHKYIVKAMEMGCDVVSEKPMTVDEVKCQEIIDTVKRTEKNLRVTFNYRYAPHNSKIRELIMNGVIGDVKQIHFEWMLNTSHGADYFRRWHRDKKNSGGLLVHKSTHHFDLVNFWLNTYPKKVFAFGGLNFYGKENAENRGVKSFYYRVDGSKNATEDPFALVMKGNENLENLYLNAEHEDGYIRDQSVFGDGISIEDTMNVLVQYESGASMSYSLNAYSPIEGFRVSFTGTKGRMVLDVMENIYVNGQGKFEDEGVIDYQHITVYPLFEKSYNVDVTAVAGGHGGGDPALLNDVFGEKIHDPLNRAASHVDGAKSILTGIAANKAIATGQPVMIEDLVHF